MTDDDLDNIEAAARGRMPGVGFQFAHPSDVLKLIAEIRRLRKAVAEFRARLDGEEEYRAEQNERGQ